VRFRRTATSERAPLWERRAARRRLLRRALLVVGVLSLAVFGIIGAVIGNSASPDTSATAALAIKRADWHGVPLHPDAVFLRTLSVDSSQYTATGGAATVGDWFEREWNGIGLRYVETASLDGTTFRWFEVTDGITSGHIFGYRRFGYVVAPSESGSCTITLIRAH
jgi:hypothetical protein